jgi:hypothetical protein
MNGFYRQNLVKMFSEFLDRFPDKWQIVIYIQLNWETISFHWLFNGKKIGIHQLSGYPNIRFN